MNTDIENVFMMLRFEVYNEDHTFSLEQKTELNNILAKAKDIDLSVTKPVQLLKNIKKITKVLQEYEDKFKEFGGDVTKLEDKLKELKKQRLKALPEIIKLK